MPSPHNGTPPSQALAASLWLGQARTGVSPPAFHLLFSHTRAQHPTEPGTALSPELGHKPPAALKAPDSGERGEVGVPLCMGRRTTRGQGSSCLFVSLPGTGWYAVGAQ